METRSRRQTRSWKQYLLWLSPAVVIVVAFIVYQQTRGPRVIGKRQPRPTFNRPQDQQAAVEPVSLKDLQGIALDDNEAELEGTWSPRQVQGAKYVGRYFQVAKSGPHLARFDVPSSVNGRFEVRMSYVAGPDRATQVTVRVCASAQGPATRTVNQRQEPAINGLFHVLGTFTFTGRTAQGKPVERIEISADGADGDVVVDAVQFVPAGDKQ